MKIKHLVLILIIMLSLTGCTNIDSLSYDDIINSVNKNIKDANVYKKGYQFFLPKGLSIEEASNNYAVITSSDTTYYLYIDLISYNAKKDFNYTVNNSLYLSRAINSNDKKGYVEIKLTENNQYLIEIMYNYAKIEMMVDNDNGKVALINAISILQSIKYNDTIIANILNDDKLNYTEEVFDLFKDSKNNSNILDYEEEDVNEEENTSIKDTDFIN